MADNQRKKIRRNVLQPKRIPASEIPKDKAQYVYPFDADSRKWLSVMNKNLGKIPWLSPLEHAKLPLTSSLHQKISQTDENKSFSYRLMDLIDKQCGKKNCEDIRNAIENFVIEDKEVDREYLSFVVGWAIYQAIEYGKPPKSKKADRPKIRLTRKYIKVIEETIQKLKETEIWRRDFLDLDNKYIEAYSEKLRIWHRQLGWSLEEKKQRGLGTPPKALYRYFLVGALYPYLDWKKLKHLKEHKHKSLWESLFCAVELAAGKRPRKHDPDFKDWERLVLGAVKNQEAISSLVYGDMALWMWATKTVFDQCKAPLWTGVQLDKFKKPPSALPNKVLLGEGDHSPDGRHEVTITMDDYNQLKQCSVSIRHFLKTIPRKKSIYYDLDRAMGAVEVCSIIYAPQELLELLSRLT